jgi:hypothetical protein
MLTTTCETFTYGPAELAVLEPLKEQYRLFVSRLPQHAELKLGLMWACHWRVMG